MKKQRAVATFSLSFLDIMCCGFGAVVLLVMALIPFKKRALFGLSD